MAETKDRLEKLAILEEIGTLQTEERRVSAECEDLFKRAHAAERAHREIEDQIVQLWAKLDRHVYCLPHRDPRRDASPLNTIRPEPYRDPQLDADALWTIRPKPSVGFRGWFSRKLCVKEKRNV
jgi:hypothetical protein